MFILSRALSEVSHAGGLREHADDSRGLPVPHSKEEEEVWPEHGAGGHYYYWTII